MHRSLLLLLLCCSSVLARDPFQPVLGAACVQPIEPLAGWRLQGIIGRDNHFQAWLLAPQGKAVKVHTGDPFPLVPWRVKTLTRHSVSLSVENSCSMQTISFQLKGRARDKDDHFNVGLVLSDASLRQ